ncbi:multiple sugar transport system substrate-binding protein [Cryobacterium mesophilum]|nr:sugar ABC transporter substrate-binding protein [Terrimesophilobacter mesophilus]MBB5632817.1 multiple sugar transport system substrate-binding protein [Terrimesophilobacter mesophilus]
MMNRISPHARLRRRGWLTGIAALGLAGLLAGCAGGGSPAEPSGDGYTPPAKDFAAEITYGVWDQTQVDAINANIEGFNKEYPNIKVNVNVTPWGDYWTKLQTQGSSSTLPDIFWMNGPNFQLYASNGMFEPITSIVDGGYIKPADYPKALIDLYTLDGVSYGVPKDFDTIAVWYNKALFAKAGVEVPKAGWTWDDIQTKAKAISTALSGDGIYGIAAATDGQSGYYDTILQAGGDVISADGKKTGYGTPEAAAGIQFWTDLITSGASPNIQQLSDTPALTWFTSGKAAMFQGGSWQRNAMVQSDIKDDVQVVELPKGERQATVIHGVANVVSAKSANKQAAQALQVYLASKAAQEQQGEMGAVIPAFNGTQQAFVDSIPQYDLQVFLDAIAYSFPYPVSKNTSAWAGLEAEILLPAFNGDVSVDKANAELATKVQAALDAE